MKVVVQPIRTEADYLRTIEEIERLHLAPIDTPDGDKVDVLIDLAEAYERRRHPERFSAPSAGGGQATAGQSAKTDPAKKAAKAQDPISAIKEAMAERGMKPIDLGPILGSTSRAYEVLNGKRGLSIAMIRGLHRELGIPLETLVEA